MDERKTSQLTTARFDEGCSGHVGLKTYMHAACSWPCNSLPIVLILKQSIHAASHLALFSFKPKSYDLYFCKPAILSYDKHGFKTETWICKCNKECMCK